MKVKLVNSLIKVFEEIEPKDEIINLTSSLHERVSFQIALYNNKKTDILVSFQHHKSIVIHTRLVKQIYCLNPTFHQRKDASYLFDTPRFAPDLLQDCNQTIQLEANTWTSIWVDLQSDMPIKDQITILINSQDQIIQKEVDFECFDFELLPLDIKHTEWFHIDGILNYYHVDIFSEKYYMILRKFIQRYVQMGANMILTPLFTPPLDTEIGGERTTVQLVEVTKTNNGFEFDFSHLYDFIQLCLEEGIIYFEFSHLFTQWGANACPKVEVMIEGKKVKYFGWDRPSSDDEYLSFLKQLIIELKQFMRHIGIENQCYFHLSDEPDLNSINYSIASNALKEVLQDCKIMEAISDYDYLSKGLLDVPVVAINKLQPFLENRPSELWGYYCCVQAIDVPNRFIAMPSTRNRALGLYLYYFQLDGFLQWGYNFYNSENSREVIDPYTTVDGNGGFPSGDCFLVYPGKDGNVEDSIRIMILEEALNDYRLFKTLENMIGRELVLKYILKHIPEYTIFQYPLEEKFYIDMKNDINRMIHGLKEHDIV